jgi:hypothetical protein
MAARLRYPRTQAGSSRGRSFAPMRFDATRTGSSSDGTSHLLVLTKREHSRFDSNDCYSLADNNDSRSLVTGNTRFDRGVGRDCCVFATSWRNPRAEQPL